MPLHTISADGMVEWGCHHADCIHHKDHPEHVPNRAHISHEDIRYVDHNAVLLPGCDCEKGSHLVAVVAWTEEELAPPIIHRDSTGKIVQVELPGAVNLTRILLHDEPDAFGRMTRVIDGVEPHPAIAHHQEFARQLAAIGKVPPPPPLSSRHRSKGHTSKKEERP